MSFKPEFLCSGEWCGNAERYATKEEAELSARSRFSAWTIPTDWRAVEASEAPNYKIVRSEFSRWVRWTL